MPQYFGNAKPKGGFRSTMEYNTAQLYPMLRYEKTKFQFTEPVKKRLYTPDFEIPPEFSATGKPIMLEMKGVLMLEDRKKLVWVRDQNPGMDLRIVFMQAYLPINPSNPSGSTYADWAVQNAFIYADNAPQIPQSWFK